MNLKPAYRRIEPCIFLVVLVASVLPLFSTTYFPTLDGPAHLYNARLLTHYSSESVLSTYFSLNHTPSPNFFGHIALYALDHVFSSAVSEKILVFFYFLSFPLGFRYFIKSYGPHNLFLSLLAIPLSHSCLMYMGFYNFSISFSFMFFGLGLYHSKIYSSDSAKPLHYIVMFLLVSLCYLSNVLCFVYLLTALSIYELQAIARLFQNGLQRLIAWRMARMILIALPALICLAVFYSRMQFQGDSVPNDPVQLFKYLIYFKSLTVYFVDSDAPYTRVLLASMGILVIYIMVLYFRTRTSFFKKQFDSLVFLLLTIALLILYFWIPNGSGAGMMTDRLCNMLFVSLALWMGSQQHIHLPKLVSPAIIIPHFFLQNIHHKEQKSYDVIAKNITASAQHIQPNSTVLSVNFLQRWMFVTVHFPNYLGAEKPLVLLDNYEAVMPWFPLNWDLEKMPRLSLNGQEKIAGIWWPESNQPLPKKEIDYVYLLGDPNDLNEAQWKELKDNLESGYVPCYIHKTDMISIYKHR